LALRCDHAAARDAVHSELDPGRDLGAGFVERWCLFTLATRAASRAEFLLRPESGRAFDDPSREALLEQGTRGADLQVVIGDGLSAAAVASQVPAVFPLLEEEARRRAWSFGRPFVVKNCRVGILNEVGDLIAPAVAVLLIGERPGLATAESLSAYMAFRPRRGQSDAHRNLVSNIHARGVRPESAARRILALAEQMRRMETSGVAVKEDLSGRTSLEGESAPPPT
jgi:ethanolamine ammonia-lyase small subunit